MQNKRITICACTSRAWMDKEKAAGIAAALKNEGYEVAMVPDLCRKAMEASPELPEIAAGVILACHPRAVHSLLEWAGQDAKQVEDIRSNSREEALARLGISCSETRDAAEKERFRNEIAAFPAENGTDAWYPVLDKTKCIECGKCHDFCLFGVYTVANKRVRVTQPQNCKNNCPACARMCPNRAIIFPKYEKSPINGGTALEETFTPGEMDAMYRERLQQRLQQRKAGIPLLKKEGE
ncbi:MAG: ferredoxin family protein [Culturomica sp.]|nr:ferredoxin family protein [Culturomica sp.]